VDRVPAVAEATTWTLSPTDLTFLWDECPRCFYKKVALGKPRPRAPFPKVFGLIDRAMKDFYQGERAEVAVPGMPLGVIGGADRWVKSAPIVFPGVTGAIVIRGRVDVLVDCDDGTVAVVDFKTGGGRADLEKYAPQLHAYALALESPARGSASSVSALGLLCFSPDRFETNGQDAAVTGGLSWTEVPLDCPAFTSFLSRVLALLDEPEAPPPSFDCRWCRPADGAHAA